jgi:hypothetical protein
VPGAVLDGRAAGERKRARGGLAAVERAGDRTGDDQLDNLNSPGFFKIGRRANFELFDFRTFFSNCVPAQQEPNLKT